MRKTNCDVIVSELATTTMQYETLQHK